MDLGNCPKCHDIPIIPSLFPKVISPSINFRFAQGCCETCKKRRKQLFGHLNFVEIAKSSLIMQMISDTGFTLVPFSPNDCSWFGFMNHGPEQYPYPLGDPKRIVKHRTQKYNWMPGSETLDFKTELWKNFERYQKKFGESEFSFYLKCFILPEEFLEFKKTFERRKKTGELWIYKPSTANRLKGIELIGSLEKLPNHAKLTNERGEDAVAQLILKDPLLLNGNRMEPRYSILVTSVHPLRVYVYDEAVVKIFGNYENVMKKSEANENIPLLDVMGEKRSTLTEFWRDMTTKGFPVQRMQDDILEIILKSLCMGEKLMGDEILKWMPHKRNVYQYWSFDFMWDLELKTYLIEINRSPAYEAANKWEFYRRHAVDMLNLVGFEVDLENVKVSGESEQRNGVDLNGLTPTLKMEDVRELMDSEDELSRMKGSGFTRIFPTVDTKRYWKYLETDDLHPYVVQDEWEKIFEGKNREKAIGTLQKLYETFVKQNQAK